MSSQDRLLGRVKLELLDSQTIKICLSPTISFTFEHRDRILKLFTMDTEGTPQDYPLENEITVEQVEALANWLKSKIKPMRQAQV
jgi:hypothetical protein